MNVRKHLFVFAAVAALALSPTLAFHSGGVAECGGCHNMHAPDANGHDLLIARDNSSVCLSCHSGSTVSSRRVLTEPAPAAGSPPIQLTPGGDFGWLKKDYTFSSHGTATTENGRTHGHNVVAYAYGLSADTDSTTAPGGGSFLSSDLACTSCHDQHGKLRRIGGDTVYSWAHGGAPIIGSGSSATAATPTATQAVGAYRILRGGVTGDTDAENSNVTYDSVLVASAPSTYNRSEAVDQTRVAYGAPDASNTVGQWCASCHPGMHSSGNYVHPIDENVGSGIGGSTGNYNKYVSSGIMTGNSATSFLSLVPFAEATGDFAVLKSHATSGTTVLKNGPDTTAEVMCLSCHRAHASGFPYALRWNYEGGEFITYADSATGVAIWPGTDNSAAGSAAGRTELETRQAYYLRPATVFGAYQRQLCNKCHAKD
jgi:predicted CXXCH cytochrome family protein